MSTIIRNIKLFDVVSDDSLEDIIVNSLISACEIDEFEIYDRDVIAINSSLISMFERNFASVYQISEDVKSKINSDNIGIVYPMIFSYGFEVIFRAFARTLKKITMLLGYPYDEAGNELISSEKLIMNDVNVTKYLISNDEYFSKYVSDEVINGYKKICEEEDCEFEVVFCNRPEVILDYVEEVIVCNVHDRDYIYERLIAHGAGKMLMLSDILNESVLGSGYNSSYGILGSKYYKEDVISLIPRNSDDFISKLLLLVKEKFNKSVEVMIYNDGAYKDPESKIWNFNSPVVSVSYTNGLEGKNNCGNKYTSLIGSICDLISENADDSIVLVQRYFDGK